MASLGHALGSDRESPAVTGLKPILAPEDGDGDGDDEMELQRYRDMHQYSRLFKGNDSSRKKVRHVKGTRRGTKPSRAPKGPTERGVKYQA